MSKEGYTDKKESINDMINSNFNKSQYSDEFKNEKFYAQNLYYLKQAFISDNKNNIKKFLASYFSNILFKVPQKFEEKLNCFYFDNEISTSPYEEKYIKANDYNFANMKEYLYKLYHLRFFDENFNLDKTYAQFDNYFSKFYPYPFSINLTPFTAPPDDAIYFNNGVISNNGNISLLNFNDILISNLNLLDFLIGYRQKKYVPVNFSIPSIFDDKILNNTQSYWDYLNESIYINESKYTMCASEIFPYFLNYDVNSIKKYNYLSRIKGNLYCFKAIYNSILSEKFRYKVAEEYIQSDKVIYLEDNLRATHQYTNIENIKNIDNDLKIRWVADEILNFSVSAFKGTLGTELLLTPFMMHKLFYFSKKRIVVNFNKYGIWEEFSRSSKDKSDLRLRLQTIINIMFSINLSDLDYHEISSKTILSNLTDRLLSCLDFYKDDKDLETFITSSSFAYINFKDFVFNLNTRCIYHKQNIFQVPNISFSTNMFTKYTLSNEEVNVNYSNLYNGLNFNKYIDEYYYEFDINKMDKYLEEHFCLDSKSSNKNLVSSYKFYYERFYDLYCKNQHNFDDDQEENLRKEENIPNLNSFEKFIKSEPFNYFIADEKNDSPLLDNPLTEKSVKDYLKSKGMVTSNQDVLNAYFNYCKNNNLEIDDFIKYYTDGKRQRDNTGQSTEFNKKLTSYFRDKNFFYDYKIKNYNIIEENIRKKVPLILKVTDGTVRGYLGFSLNDVTDDMQPVTTIVQNPNESNKK